MKDIILPVTTVNSVDLAFIREDTKGIIIVYDDKGPIGYINYCDQEWYYYEDINGNEFSYSEYSLVDLINKLIANYESIRFKLLEFECETSY